MAIVTALIDPPDLKNISQIDENSINFFLAKYVRWKKST